MYGCFLLVLVIFSVRRSYSRVSTAGYLPRRIRPGGGGGSRNPLLFIPKQQVDTTCCTHHKYSGLSRNPLLFIPRHAWSFGQYSASRSRIDAGPSSRLTQPAVLFLAAAKRKPCCGLFSLKPKASFGRIPAHSRTCCHRTYRFRL